MRAKKTSPAPGPFVVYLVDRVHAGRQVRLLPRLPKKSKATKKLRYTTTLGRYAATYSSEAEARTEAAKRDLPAKYKVIVGPSAGVDFSPISRGKRLADGPTQTELF